MEIRQLIDMQSRLDEANGFAIRFADQNQKYDQLTKDIVGFVGEIGEFANTLKKINIKRDRDEYEFDVNEAAMSLQEELADCTIYLLRIAAILDFDLEKAVVSKIEANSSRYARLRRG